MPNSSWKAWATAKCPLYDLKRCRRIVFAGIGCVALSVIIIILWFFGCKLLECLRAVFLWIWDVILHVPDYANHDDDKKFERWLGLIGALIAFLTASVAVFTFWSQSRQNRKATQKQHTITILLETRLSDHFQQMIRSRAAYFSEGKPVIPDTFYEAYNGSYDPGAAICKKTSAASLVKLLNHYEFIAVGIALGDLEETMLKQTIRGIVCRLVNDCRHLIAEEQKQNPKTYEHLSALYHRWRDPSKADEQPIELLSKESSPAGTAEEASI